MKAPTADPTPSSEENPKPKRTNSLNSSIDKAPNTNSHPSNTVRTSSRDQKLDKHRYHQTSISIPKKSSSLLKSPLASIEFPRRIRLTSIEQLRQSVDDQGDEELTNLIRKFVYVGTIDDQTSLIQYETELYLIHTRILSEELFYQLFIYHFGNFGTIHLNESDEAPNVEVRSILLGKRKANSRLLLGFDSFGDGG